MSQTIDKDCVEVLITRTNNTKDLPLPSYATEESAGMDLLADIEEDVILKPNENIFIPTGIAIQIPKNHEAQIRSRSGLAAKYSIVVFNSPATIDSDYRGELKVVLKNFGTESFTISRGMRIAQLLVKPVPKIKFIQVNCLDKTKRGDGGFGSTGL